MKQSVYGLMAEFTEPGQILAAAKAAHERGYRKMDAYTPFPVEKLAEYLGKGKSIVPAIVLIAAIGGGLSGYFMEWYAATISYPLNIGGRPLNSWPAFIPIIFELTVLSGAIAGMVSMLALNRLPEPHHPVFNVAEFERASSDRFFLCIEAVDPIFDLSRTKSFLEELKPQSVWEVAP
jgi:hypothetical protein